MEKAEIWKLVGTSLASVLVTIAFMWFTLVRSFVTQDQVSVLLETRSPYVQDRQIVLKNVEVTEKLVIDVNNATKELASTQQAIIAKLDSILLFVNGIQDRVTNLENRMLYLERGSVERNSVEP